MAYLTPLVWRHKSQFLPLLACRMVKYSLEYGFCKDSIHAFNALSLAFVYGCRDEIDTGIKWGNFSKSLMDFYGAKEFTPTVYLTLYAAVRIWKEPSQALQPPLFEAYRVGLECGNIGACFPSCYFIYIIPQFHLNHILLF